MSGDRKCGSKAVSLISYEVADGTDRKGEVLTRERSQFRRGRHGIS